MSGFQQFVQKQKGRIRQPIDRARVAVTVLTPLCAIVTALLFALDDARTALAFAPSDAGLSCRFGINAPWTPITEFDTRPLRLGWYIDYGAAAEPARPDGIEYVSIIHLRQTGPNSYTASPNGTTLQNRVRANRGAAWIIGNEPDRRIFQNDMEPHLYATAYHHLDGLIKAADPTAKVYAGAIVQATPLRLRYLDMVLESHYRQFGAALRADGWAIHNFILNEASCQHYNGDLRICWGADIPPGIDETDGIRITVNDNDNFDLFTQQIRAFRLWMHKRGYGGQPVLLSEYGVLMPVHYFPEFDAARVNAFMNRTFDYLRTEVDPVLGDPNDGYRLIQRFAWYSTIDRNFNGFIYDNSLSPPALTAMGQNWAAYASALVDEVDFYPVKLSTVGPPPLASDGPSNITLRAVIANSGNTLGAQPVTVRFYDGDPTQGGQLIGDPRTVTLAGCGAQATATVRWDGVPPGVYRVYVDVTAGAGVTERNLADNRLSTTVFFATDQLHLPVVMRFNAFRD